jgi:transposase InsO family protein
MILSLEKLRVDYKTYRKKDPFIAEKIDILISITKFELTLAGEAQAEARQKKISAFLADMELSERTLQRWKKAYSEEGGAEGLGKKIASGRPPGEIPLNIQSIIKNYRSKYKWGSEVIQAHLKHDHDYTVSRHKVERYLDVSGLRKEFPCTTIKKQKAQKEKKHTKKVVVTTPGAHTQMDVKYQLHLLTNKQKCYVYNFIDHASNWSFKNAYPAINERNTLDFMKKLMEKCPFEIMRLQTDNGIEFTFKYISGAPDEPKEHLLGKFCKDHNINHKLIPPGEKELQGLVERSHRQDDQELFSRIHPNELDQFNKLLEEYANERNKGRRFKKLNWKTPTQWLNDYIIQTIATVLHINSQENAEGNFPRVSAEAKILEIKKKFKEDEKVENGASTRKLAA